MIQFSQVSLQRGTQFLLENADMTLFEGQRVGLIGANGAGKSSLFALVRGELSADTGEVLLPGQRRIAFMAQEVEETHRSALDYCLDGDDRLREIEAHIEKSQTNGDDHAHAHWLSEYENAQGYTAKSRGEMLLQGLGFKMSDMDRPVADFSGGWRIRLNLAQALMSPSDILLLDEPTNHLDLDAVMWLESWLRAYPGTLFLISHDRDFLDGICSHIVHLFQKKLTLYTGHYSAYERQRAEHLAQQQATHEAQQTKRAHLQKYVDRFRYKANKAKQAQSRLKMLEKMETIGPAHVDSQFQFSIPFADKTSDQLVNLIQADLGYVLESGEKKVQLAQTAFSIRNEQRIGLLGPNGAGKSTLIKTLVGELDLLDGERIYGENTKVGYFSQHQLSALDLEASPVLHIQRISPKALESDVRKYLGGFGFTGDDALRPVKGFSGGEKARLALSLIAWQKPNLLVLDEPTNHLDIEMRHALTEALQEFEGAILVVSHDRHLLNSTVDEFYLVADHQVVGFDGDLKSYHDWLQARQQASKQSDSADLATGQVVEKVDKKEERRRAAEKREQLRPLKKALEKHEKGLQNAQQQLDGIAEKMADSTLYEAQNKDTLQVLLAEEATWKKTLEEHEEAWFIAQEALEEAESEL
ncbi:ATP-binding cassette domain-containing protein [Marinomonas mediterranea]|uniref:Probable ATP-binding protein YheS n=1 Tax=Marinomonas mediterranea (strain ATCC 700492 / JCM 21426 / NBRC 103028 / MMB-1) TaxID=717774 RepID=F2JTR2_MARM1|nr:ATP-binding cassette domain-containing protein [Marinomonas mediterranea]ADZ92682.1 ABC transporter related protein [Marinomonas mediterranea MMB-1]WCN10617.1 ATP-binding cassette domain-containing protein [Marinomonas mediterranea]WCN18713.1 ATP-binding cassette domain-containing protein [Marinomonas mediterranea MMB-1]